MDPDSQLSLSLHEGCKRRRNATKLGTEALAVLACQNHLRPVEGDGKYRSNEKQYIVEHRPEQTLTSSLGFHLGD